MTLMAPQSMDLSFSDWFAFLGFLFWFLLVSGRFLSVVFSDLFAMLSRDSRFPKHGICLCIYFCIPYSFSVTEK